MKVHIILAIFAINHIRILLSENTKKLYSNTKLYKYCCVGHTIIRPCTCASSPKETTLWGESFGEREV